MGGMYGQRFEKDKEFFKGRKNEDIGVIEVQDLCSYVDILNHKGEALVKKYKEISIKKKMVKLRKDRQN